MIQRSADGVLSSGLRLLSSRERSAAPQSMSSTSTITTWGALELCLCLQRLRSELTNALNTLADPASTYRKRCCSKKEGKDDASTLLQLHTVLTHLPMCRTHLAPSGPWYKYIVHACSLLTITGSIETSRKYWQFAHPCETTPHADSGRADVASSERCRCLCPRLKSRGGQRRSGSHIRWGSESGLGRPPLDLLDLHRSGSVPHGTTPDWRRLVRSKQ